MATLPEGSEAAEIEFDANEDKCLTLELRTAAMACSNVDYRQLLRMVAEGIESYIDEFIENPTKANLAALNGAWAKGQRVLDNTPPEAPPAPLSGSPEITRLAA